MGQAGNDCWGECLKPKPAVSAQGSRGAEVLGPLQSLWPRRGPAINNRVTALLYGARHSQKKVLVLSAVFSPVFVDSIELKKISARLILINV